MDARTLVLMFIRDTNFMLSKVVPVADKLDDQRKAYFAKITDEFRVKSVGLLESPLGEDPETRQAIEDTLKIIDEIRAAMGNETPAN